MQTFRWDARTVFGILDLLDYWKMKFGFWLELKLALQTQYAQQMNNQQITKDPSVVIQWSGQEFGTVSWIYHFVIYEYGGRHRPKGPRPTWTFSSESLSMAPSSLRWFSSFEAARSRTVEMSVSFFLLPWPFLAFFLRLVKAGPSLVVKQHLKGNTVWSPSEI